MILARSLLVLALAGAVLAVAGCGGSTAPSVAHIGRPTAPTTTAPAVSGVGRGPAGGPAAVFFGCIRTHGVPDFPASPTPGKMLSTTQFNQRALQRATAVCVKLVPADAPPSLVPHPVAPLLAFSRCMRAHGVAGFPDPTSEGHFPGGLPATMDPNSPLFQTAQHRCAPLAHGELGGQGV